MRRTVIAAASIAVFILISTSPFANRYAGSHTQPVNPYSPYAPQKREHSGLYPIQQNGVWGYCDRTGAVVIKPRFGTVGEFREGLAAVGVRVAQKGGYTHKYGYIDTKGRFVIAPRFKYAGLFSGGLASVDADGRRGYIDRNGTLVIRQQFEEAGEFSEEGAVVKAGGKYGLIDRSGRYVITPQFDALYGFSEGLAAVAVGELGNQKHGYIDKTGRYVIEPRFEFAHNFSEGLAVVSVGKYPDNRDGFIDRTGNFVIRPQFQHVRSFSEGLAQVVVGGKWGFIDRTGNIVIRPQYDYAEQFSEGLAAIEVRRSYGYIDRDGQVVIAPRFDRANSFSGGVALVTLDDKDTYIDKTGGPAWGTGAGPVPPATRKKVSDGEQENIVRQMVADGELTESCVEEEGGPKKAVRVETLDLNRDRMPELVVSGKQGCTCGARRCYQWIYRKTPVGYELMLNAGPVDDIAPMKISTNGYPDLETSSPAGNDFVLVRYKFDGRRYQQKGCEVVKYLGERRGSPVFGRRRPCGND